MKRGWDQHCESQINAAWLKWRLRLSWKCIKISWWGGVKLANVIQIPIVTRASRGQTKVSSIYSFFCHKLSSSEGSLRICSLMLRKGLASCVFGNSLSSDWACFLGSRLSPSPFTNIDLHILLSGKSIQTERKNQQEGRRAYFDNKRLSCRTFLLTHCWDRISMSPKDQVWSNFTVTIFSKLD